MALIPMTPRTLRALVLGPALLALAACGSGQQDPLVTAVRSIGGGALSGLSGGGGDAPQGPPVSAATVPPALIARIEGPLILVETLDLGGTTLMTQVGRNGRNRTWRGPEGFGLTATDDFVLRSTRGLGFDLMASDTRPTEAALAAQRAGDVQRLMVHLDGDLQQDRDIYTCTLTRNGPDTVTIAGTGRSLERVTESCRGDGDFTNIYWLDAGGRAVQSRQWVSDRIGHVRISILRD